MDFVFRHRGLHSAWRCCFVVGSRRGKRNERTRAPPGRPIRQMPRMESWLTPPLQWTLKGSMNFSPTAHTRHLLSHHLGAADDARVPCFPPKSHPFLLCSVKRGMLVLRCVPCARDFKMTKRGREKREQATTNGRGGVWHEKIK